MYFVCNQRADAGFAKPGQFTQQLAQLDSAAAGLDSAAVIFNSATVEYSAAVAFPGASQIAAAEHLCYLRTTGISIIRRLSNLSLYVSDLSVLILLVSIPRVFTALLLSPLVADYCIGGPVGSDADRSFFLYVACQGLCAAPSCKWIISYKSDIYQQHVKHNQNCSSILSVKLF